VIHNTGVGGLTHIGFTCVEEKSDTIVDQLREECTGIVHTVTLE
jgi:hypothetical protein